MSQILELYIFEVDVKSEWWQPFETKAWMGTDNTMAMRTHGGDKSSKGKNIPLVNLGLIPILISLIDLLKGEQV